MSNQAELNTNPEDNPKMKEIFDILLLSGYFRIRIPSIKSFDKIIGGLSWCIACSNFDIDIEYNEDMNLGQKIKVAEKICDSLKRMKCPHNLQPFQIQGLDFTKIQPVVNWLIQFVYATRELRQDFNREMSNFVGKKVYKHFDMKDRKDKQIMQDTSNYLKTMDKRVYSNLIEYGDVTSIKTYNKLCALVTGKLNLESEMQKQQAVKSKAKTGGLSEDRQNKIDMNQLLFHATNSVNVNLTKSESVDIPNRPSLQNTNQGEGGQKTGSKNIFQQKFKAELIQNQQQKPNLNTNIFKQESAQQVQQNKKREKRENQDEYDQMEALDFTLDEDQKANFRTLERRGSKIGDQLMQLVMQNQEKISESLKQVDGDDKGGDEFEFAKIISNEKEFHQNQVQAIKKKIAAYEKEIEELGEELSELKTEDTKLNGQIEENKTVYEDLQNASEVIQKKIDALTKNSQMTKELQETENLVSQKTELEERKQTLKKEIKAEFLELEKQKEKAEKDLPKFDDNYQKQLMEEVAQKKEKYDKKFKDVAQINQELAILQRKMESFPSPTEIAQYHQRFMELLDNINNEMERQRNYYTLFNNAQDVKNMVAQFVDIMRTFKENYQLNRKSKSGRENFISELTQTYTGLQSNLAKSSDLFNKQKISKEQKQELYLQLTTLEREYFKKIKDLNLELEKSEYLLSQK